MNIELIIEDFLNTPVEQVTYTQTRPIIEAMWEELIPLKPNELVSAEEEPAQRAYYEKWKDVANHFKELEKLRNADTMETRVAIHDAKKVMNWFPWGFKHAISEY